MPPAPTATIIVRNALNLARHAETVSLPLPKLPAGVRQLRPGSLRVRDAASKNW